MLLGPPLPVFWSGVSCFRPPERTNETGGDGPSIAECDAHGDGAAPDPPLTHGYLPAIYLDAHWPGIQGDRVGGRYGTSLTVVPDIDGDGLDEVAAAEWGSGFTEHQLHFHTGAQLVERAASSASLASFESSDPPLAAMDIDFDGSPELLTSGRAFHFLAGPTPTGPPVDGLSGWSDDTQFGLGNIWGGGTVTLVTPDLALALYDLTAFADQGWNVQPPKTLGHGIDLGVTAVTAYDFTSDGVDDVARWGILTTQLEPNGPFEGLRMFESPLPREDFHLDDFRRAAWTTSIEGATALGLSSAGDTTGDGTNDLLVHSFRPPPGDARYNSVTRLLTDPATGEHSLADAQGIFRAIHHEPGEAHYRTRIVGDLSNDGFADMVLHDEAGLAGSVATYIYFGPACGILDLAESADLVLSYCLKDWALAPNAGRNYVMFGADL